MSKIKTAFFCSNCGYESPKWLGKCPSCSSWNTFQEEVINTGTSQQTTKDALFGNTNRRTKSENTPVKLEDIGSSSDIRISTQDSELNRVLGGGIVPGSIILVAGEPGIGKSTLFLQMALMQKNLSVLYVSGEESAQQIKMRADRLQIRNDNFYLLPETSTNSIFKSIKEVNPDLIIIDSIQTLQSEFIEAGAGSIAQIKECAAEFQQYAKSSQTTVFLIGHITKDGTIAGPKILEHMVDTVLQFEGDRHYAYRILRTLKNRFGSTAEIGIYEMNNAGMRIVENPSEILMTQRDEQLSGSAIAATMEGIRPLLVEVQALVTQSVYGTPQRTVSGFDLRRLQLLLAVLEKRGGFALGSRDVFINIAGGLKIDDPSTDLPVICALLSSYEDIPISQQTCFAGEVGLSGEIRAVNRIEQRISEAEKLGFEKIFISKYNKKGIDTPRHKIEIIPVSQVLEVFNMLF